MSPSQDGVNHINIYSKGKTTLGRMLSNFYFSPFVLPNHGKFSSVEGYWYWLSTKDEKLRELFGFEAKKRGQFLKAPDWVDTQEFKDSIKESIKAKIDQNPLIKKELKQSSLPLVHYYVYGDKIVKVPKGQWIVDFIEQYRKEIQASI